MKIDLDLKYENLIAALKSQAPFEPELALILGSGLGDFANSIEKELSIPTESLPDYPKSTVTGHKGFIHFGKFQNKNLILFQGRIHFYEGYSLEQVVLPVFIANSLNAKRIILTNAAGGINQNFKAGDLMLTTAFYPLFIKKELAGILGSPDVETKNRFLDFPSKKFNETIRNAAVQSKIYLREGSYWYSKGPNYETPAEIKMMLKFGAAAVGMSTVHEAITANYFGLQVAAISLITNLAAGISAEKLSHKEVMEAGEKAKPRFEKLIKSIIEFI